MSEPFFTVVMPSYLGDYPGAATGRDWKIRRAIDSVLFQSFQDFELFIVADGCQKTIDIVLENYAAMPQIRLVGIPKQPVWSGRPRNLALTRGKGLYAVYLDVDDKYGKDHLQIIHDNLNGEDWVWFDDLLGGREKTFTPRSCNIKAYGEHGTSNICHKRDIVRWPDRATYSKDDFGIIETLRKNFKNYTKIATPQYMVCHVPVVKTQLYPAVDI